MRLKLFRTQTNFNRKENLGKPFVYGRKKNLKKNMRLNATAFNRTFQSQELTGVAFRSLLFLCQTPILILKIDSTDNRYQDNGSCNNNCIHLLFFFNSSFLPSFTQYIPYPRTITSRGDRYLGVTAGVTQMPVPTATEFIVILQNIPN